MNRGSVSEFIVVAQLALVSLLLGCATTQPTLPPVATVAQQIPLSAVKNAIISTYISEGWRMEKETDHLLSFATDSTDLGAQILFGSRYDYRVMVRETVVIIETPSGITMRVSEDAVSNYGSGFERSRSWQGKCGERLLRIKTELENQHGTMERGGRPKARAGYHTKSWQDGTVIDVAPNSPAEKAGLVKGCRILSINGKEFSRAVVESEILSRNPGDRVAIVWLDVTGSKVGKGEITLEAQ